ncbi:pilus assembly protein [Zoogloea sp.]|uniref:pilus assembly protein n=1 Tax=Zoogloea sp. TaxID=49181 RepID=UPI0035ADBD0C
MSMRSVRSAFVPLLSTSLALLCGVFGLARAGSTNLYDQPIGTSDVPANVALALSVEFPTAITVAHRGDFDSTGATVYLGYFDPLKCYNYTGTYFEPVGFTGDRYTCSNQWSGNFMNWATMQGIDIFRWVLTGGYRDTDTPLLFSSSDSALTILQRAYAAYQGRADTNFPDRTLPRSLASSYTDTTSHNMTDQDVRVRNWSFGRQAILGWGTYNIRVQVCKNASVGDKSLLESNCQEYSTTNASGVKKSVYKPVGLIQQYKDKMYFGSFGYLLLSTADAKDANNVSNADKPGGVMRSKVQSVASEITETGAFVADPYGLKSTDAGIDNSGTINYLNMFGFKSGAYKYYDPVSELYAEIIKYYKNMSPTGVYVSGLNAALRDGFPVITEWNDPAQDALYPNSGALSCKKNYIIGIGDSNTAYDFRLSGGQGTIPADVDSDLAGLTTAAWTTRVGDTEGISGLASMRSYQGSYFLSGLAYYAHSSDIRSDISGRQTVTTYWMDVREGGSPSGKNLFWLAAKYGGYKKPSVSDDPYPFNSTTDTWNASGRTLDGSAIPDNYYSASTPASMRSGLISAFKTIASGQGAAAGIGLSNIQLNASTGGAFAYQGGYDASTWYGYLKAYTVTGFDSNMQPQLTLAWDAAARLDAVAAGSGWDTARKIITLAPESATNNTPSVAQLLGTPFRFSNLSNRQKLNLSATSSNASGDDTDGARILEYLRGNRTNESTDTETKLYRQRGKLLGDIVDSKVVYLGAPSADYADTYNPGYSTFKSTYLNRAPRIFVGANDGMLHAFDASSDSVGDEIFGLIPYSMFAGPDDSPEMSGLQALARTNYSHHFYMNATPEIRDVDFNKVNGRSGDPDWRTILVVGQGKGGKSFVAMDVTSLPSSATETQLAGKVLWEFSHNNMGYSFGQPLIAKTRKWGWVVILTGGYNNTSGNRKGRGALFVLNARTGELLQDIYTSEGSEASPAGLAQVEGYVQSYADFTLDYVYGGDLLGNVWRFDFTSDSDDVPSPTLLAQLRDPSGNAQPVTVAPKIEYSADDLKRYVFVGTGRLLHSQDQANTQTQTFYALRDGTKPSAFGTEDNQTDIPSGGSFPITRAQMSQVTSLISGITLDATKPMGWYYDLAGVNGSVKERITVTPEANDGVVSWVGNIYNNDPCNPTGSARIYSVSYGTAQSVLYTLVDTKYSTIQYATSDKALADITLVKVGNSVKIIGTDVTGSSSTYGTTVSGGGTPRVVNWRILRQ